jgi:hypothetical protein
MARPWKSSRSDHAPRATGTITEVARRYHACAMALAKSFGMPLTADFLQAYHSAISSVYIEAGRAGIRLPAGVQLPPLVVPNNHGQPPNGHPVEPVTEHVREWEPTDTPEAGAPEPPTNGHAPPVAIPTDAGLPCGGQVIADLKPAQLAMLVSKVATLAHAEGERWGPLLGALQSERGKRLERGRKLPTPEGDGDGT